MYNNRKFFIYLPIAFALILIAGFFLGATLVNVGSSDDALFKGLKAHSYDPVSDVIRYIKQDYVDSVDEKALTQSAIEGILADLDPHSQYIPAEEFNDVNDPLLGSFDGIGVQFRIEKDTVFIINTIPGGPSEKTGIMGGDRIVEVEGKNIAGTKITNNEVMKLLKGPRGTKVNVGVKRRGVNGLLKFTITRDAIPTYSIDTYFLPQPGIGYIKLSKFSATTADELNDALNKLKAKGMKRLILDLRGNSGGYLQAAISVADAFLPSGQPIVYTEGLNRPKQTVTATKNGLFESGKLIVLVDEGSASSSEIVAGALQDNDRATLIGRRTFGKGLVQEQLSLPDGSAIRLTVARYYTPTGRSIQKPYKTGHASEYNDELYLRMAHGELENQDSIKFSDSLRYTTPGGRTVYGGGGIMPDIFIPVEKDPRYAYYNEVSNKGLIFEYAFDYTDRNRERLQKYSGFEEFNRDFNISDAEYNQFVAFAEKSGIKRNTEGIAFNRNEISDLVKALIARNLYDDKGFYPIYLQSDKTFKEALKVIAEN